MNAPRHSFAPGVLQRMPRRRRLRLRRLLRLTALALPMLIALVAVSGALGYLYGWAYP